ncbi:type VI secretion system baseplate subunit TssE [Trinickia diaoshuihuensis]|jgi:type VI secretion system protein ImpF|uniref:type VI secretion system baseplate subunit TssE n=1 Tax=Trinickia diaoshuihuensis TaxID=2292265 RepID=UPI000E23DB66|nr:type VI secretion system baseplate subunit TssE [Trinickia diaoshuihuensis]
MSEPTSRDRLQPALLDRLSDDAPHERTEPRERRAMSSKQLRASVLRDLSSLLNAHALYGCATLAAHPLAAASVLNYGLRDVTGTVRSSLNVGALGREVERTITRFEPRIVAGTLRVRPLESGETGASASVCFLVEADLWAQPYPERLYFKTELDLESGQARIIEGAPAGSSVPMS